MSKLTFTLVAAVLMGIFFSSAVFMVSLVVPAFSAFVGKLFIAGALVGAYYGFTQE